MVRAAQYFGRLAGQREGEGRTFAVICRCDYPFHLLTRPDLSGRIQCLFTSVHGIYRVTSIVGYGYVRPPKAESLRYIRLFAIHVGCRYVRRFATYGRYRLFSRGRYRPFSIRGIRADHAVLLLRYPGVFAFIIASYEPFRVAELSGQRVRTAL